MCWLINTKYVKLFLSPCDHFYLIKKRSVYIGPMLKGFLASPKLNKIDRDHGSGVFVSATRRRDIKIPLCLLAPVRKSLI